MPDELVSESKSILRQAFDWFRAGNKRLGQVSLGLLIASWLAIGIETGFVRHVSFDQSDLHIRVLFWVMGAGFGSWFLFTQHKFEAWRNLLGQTDMEDWRDWTVLLASAAAFLGLLLAVSEALA